MVKKLGAFSVFLTIFAALLVDEVALAQQDVQRYRGDYTWGHEVNSFCPQINAQCFWVQGKSSVLADLRAVYDARSSEPYQSICMVIEGVIDRTTARTGFAADFDGLLTIERLFGSCEETRIVTHADLQHHRWLLSRVNGKPIDTDAFGDLVPELDFGERMHVAGNAGCNRYTGTGELRDEYFVIRQMAITARLCGEAHNTLEQQVRTVLGQESVITVDENKVLTLDIPGTVLEFVLKDWVR